MDPSSLALFTAYPDAVRAMPHVALGCWPTPLQVNAGSDLGLDCAQLMIKRDDLSAQPYGGNKIRKLEFLLAAARARGARGVITFGVAGSNHALATSICARECGLQSHALLTRQANASYVRRNLLAGMHAGANLIACGSEAAAISTSRQLVDDAGAQGEPLYVIPGGGSSAVGCLGFVNAGLELAAQLQANDIDPPDLIYLALGTVGTAAGLQLGLHLGGLHTRLVPIRVVREDIGSPARFRSLLKRTAALLRETCGIDPGDHSDRVPRIRDDFIGPGYARFTPEAIDAIRQAKQLLGLSLDPTYTGKAFAALLADMRAGSLRKRRVMFWNTYSSRPLADAVLHADYRDLPEPFHWYFEHPVQALDPDANEAG
ncbi:MAG: pyridoxal-phosphate dependent enzyme [Gammaproteobacteria bacterium]